MSKVRVYEVARQLGMPNRELVALFQSLGFSEVRNHMSAVEAEVVERVKRKLERQKAPEVVEERIRPTVVKRRSRAADGAARQRAVRAAEPPPAPVAKEPAPAKMVAAPPSAPGTAGPVPVAVSAEATARAATEPSQAAPPPAAAAEAAVPSVPTAEPSAAGPPSADAAPPAAAPEAAPPAPPSAQAAEELAVEPAIAPPAGEPEAASEPSSISAEIPEPAAPPAPSAPGAESLASVTDAASPDGREESAPPAAGPARRAGAPKSGIEVWEGRPGVPMPQRPRANPAARRTTYDPRANVPNRRPGYGYGGRTMPGRPMRPGFRRGPGGAWQRPGERRKGPVEVSTKEMSAHKKFIKVEGETSLQNLAAKMSVKATDVLMRLLSMGMAGVNINSSLDPDTAKLLASEFGWSVEDVSIDEESSLEAAMAMEAEGDETGEAIIRPAIVTVMGHVDHGKTTLLDYIRKTSVASGEAGGITQHIGAYRVETPKGTVAFLDTPGHEAFTAMRARGANITDIVVLIVAADDGVMPQTREAIHHARDGKVPIIVAVNKIDKPGVDPEKIMRDLAAEGLQPEDWGGDTLFCRVSAKTGEGVDNLLDNIMLQAEMLELRAYPERRATGVVVEALLDRGRGPVARVLVQDGTLHRGDVLLAGPAYGKIRAMLDEMGRKLAEAGPATPVEVLGLNEVPSAGDPVHAVKDIKAAEAIASDRKSRSTKAAAVQDTRVSLEALTSRLSEDEQFELNVIIKADVQGSVEALQQALTKLSTDKVKLGVVHTGVGGITETDVNLAVASKGIIIGFNVRPAGKAKKAAEQEGVEIRLYDVIYECIDEVRSAMEGLLPATLVEKSLGRAEVRELFRISKVGSVAGCMVVEGLMRRGARARLVRDDVVVWSGKLGSLRRFKDDAREVKEGLECGISLEGYGDVKQGDVVECFEIEEVRATL